MQAYTRWKQSRDPPSQLQREGIPFESYNAILRSTELARKGLWLLTEINGKNEDLVKRIQIDLPTFKTIDCLPYLAAQQYELYYALMDMERKNNENLIHNPTFDDRQSDKFFGGILNYPDNPSIQRKHVLILPIDFSDFLDDMFMSTFSGNIRNFYDRLITNNVKHIDLNLLK